jgi:N-formylglutamate amidohydrolase
MEPLYQLQENDGPLLLNFPHSGTHLPSRITGQLNQRGPEVADTDWHVPELYDFARGSVSWLQATHSRYVVDLNRDPEGVDLYPGQAGTELCPTTDFAGQPIYQNGEAPNVSRRRAEYFLPYHDVLAAQIERITEHHGYCILLDCHSILGRVPRLFDGQLPDLNLGSYGGNSCSLDLADCAMKALEQKVFPTVHNGRFQGGWITRHYGQPANGVHALQLEIAQSAYMDEDNPQQFSPEMARPLQSVLQDLIQALQDHSPV